ncbi:MAG: IclR family transcriptional regulator [Bryobacteraceae bacterium]
MSSLTKLLSILEFFEVGNSFLTAEEIVSRLGCSRPQGYRYIKELCSAGLLTRFSGAYSLGPRIIELDFVIRSADPLLQIARPVIRDLSNRVSCDVTLVKLFGDHMVAIHHEENVQTSGITYSRGRPMPIFRGCGFKLVLAYLPTSRQKQFFERYPEAVQTSTLGKSWEEMRADLKKIRKSGYAVSAGELDAGSIGLAAPVFEAGPSMAPCALTLIVPESRYETSNQQMLVEIVKDVASDISARLVHFPAKAVS